MTCGCSGDLWCEDGEEAAFYRETPIKATRKEHRCCECGDVIPKESRCCSFSYSYDGFAATEYRCLVCAALVEYIATQHRVCINVLGHLRDACQELNVDWEGWRSAGKRSA